MWQLNSNLCLHLHMLLKAVPLCLCQASFSFVCRDAAFGFRAYSESRRMLSGEPQLDYSHKGYFLRRPYSQVPGVRTWTILFWGRGTVSPPPSQRGSEVPLWGREHGFGLRAPALDPSLATLRLCMLFNRLSCRFSSVT